jgi:Methyltransferase domain
LVLSQLAERHLCFTTAWDESLKTTQSSPMLNSAVVQFVIGSTQQTLPTFKFEHQLDFVLIDGPHGYPFPDLEYYFFYQHLRPGAILAVDDTHIPTIRRMYEIIREDAMFDVVAEIRNLAFLQRTNHKTFPPFSDGWFEQAYNLNRIEDKKALEGLYGTNWWVNRGPKEIPQRKA